MNTTRPVPVGKLPGRPLTVVLQPGVAALLLLSRGRVLDRFQMRQIAVFLMACGFPKLKLLPMPLVKSKTAAPSGVRTGSAKIGGNDRTTTVPRVHPIPTRLRGKRSFMAVGGMQERLGR